MKIKGGNETMKQKTQKFSVLLLSILMVLSLAMIAACNNGSDETANSETPSSVYTIGLNAQMLELKRYGRADLSATVYKDGVATSDAVDWSSGNTSIATVSDGVIIAVGEGSTQIIASAHGQNVYCSVSVTDEGVVPRLIVSDETIPLMYNSENPSYYDIVAEVEFYDYDTSDAVITYKAIQLTSSVIDISTDGRVTAKKAGKATVLVSAIWNGYECIEVPVSVIVYDDIEVQLFDDEDTILTPDEETLLYTWGGIVQGSVFANTKEISVKVLKESKLLADAAVTWFSDNNDVVMVEKGIITAKEAGTAKIWCEYSDGVNKYESLRCTVKVSYPWVDLTEKNDAKFLFKENSAFDFLELYIGEDAVHQTDAVYADGCDTSILINGKINIDLLAGGANILLFADADTYGYILPVTVITKNILSAQDFDEWRKIDGNHGSNNQTVYTYGKDEYILLSNDITISDADWGAYRNGAYAGFFDGNDVGFTGTFDGNGHTITVQSVGTGGLFGDLGRGSVIKNLGVIAQLTGKSGSRAAAIAALVEGASLDNCYIQAKTGGDNSYGGVVFAGVMSLEMTNCVIDSTPGIDVNAAWSSILTSYVRQGWEDNLKFENVVGISNTAGNAVFARVMNDAGNAYVNYSMGVTIIDGSADGFNIETYNLTSFDASGFNTKYFFVEDGYIPQWNKTASDFEAVLAFSEDSVDITTDTEADNHTVEPQYNFTYRGAMITPENVVWTITKGESCVSVTQEGVITGTAEGTAVITLTVTYKGQNYIDTVTVNVTIPTNSFTPVQEIIFNKTNTTYDTIALVKALWGNQVDKTITDIRYGSAAASASIISDSAFDWTNIPVGENRVFYVVSDNIAYEFTAKIVSKQIGSAEEFMTWRKANQWSGRSESGTRVKYSYGKDEYILLTGSFTITEELMQRVYLEGMYNTVYPDIGFMGVFDGNGYTITAEKAALSGLFGDMGEGSVIKNLGVIATISNTSSATNIGVAAVRPAALANRAYGVTLQDCYFEVACGTNINHSGLLFATAAEITIKNCIIVGTPGYRTSDGSIPKASSSALVTSWVPINHYNSIYCEDVVAVSRDKNNQAFAINGNNSAFVTDVTVIDGSTELFDITTYELTGIDINGYNTKYFVVTENRIPQWKSIQA